MATLKRGISFRRQGSSGLSWADSWTFTDDGIFQAKGNDAAAVHHHAEPASGPMAPEFRVGKVKMEKPQKASANSNASTAPVLTRSVSAQPARARVRSDAARKPTWGFGWIKHKFLKSKS